MSMQRFIQNFRNRRAHIFSADARAVAALATTLPKLGLCVERVSEEPGDEALDAARDILFVDGDMHEPPSLPLHGLGALAPAPVVGLVGVEAPSRLRGLVQAGATAFLTKPVHAGSIFSALYLSVNEYERKRQIQAAVDELEERRRLRRYVVKAVALTMHDGRLDDEVAFDILRRRAMRARLSVEKYCEYVVRTRAAEPVRPAGAIQPVSAK